jgi:hypothetical protein
MPSLRHAIPLADLRFKLRIECSAPNQACGGLAHKRKALFVLCRGVDQTVLSLSTPPSVFQAKVR